MTDGLRAYPHAIKQSLGRTVTHIKNVGLLDKKNNNRIERYHNTWRGREKGMRRLETKGRTEKMLENFKTYYNYLRSHNGINGHTPAEMVGIDLQLGRNKMLDLLERSVAPECTN